MAALYFPSHATAEVIQVEFVRKAGGSRILNLLVDPGFTGASSFVLASEASDLMQAVAPAAMAAGALRGSQKRIWIRFRIPQLNLQRSMIAILADSSNLPLPAGVDGLAGLTFLRQFQRWGAERTDTGERQFIIDNGGG